MSWLIVGACTIENAKVPREKELVIASDYLEESDTTVFEGFSKKFNVSVHIISMDATQIQHHLTNQGMNAGIDLVMIKSMHDVHQFQRKKLFQPINFEDEFEPELTKYSSWKYDYVGYGLDPYIIVYPREKTNSIKTYNDLTRFDYLNAVSYGDQVGILAPVLHKMKKVNANNWIKKYVDHGVSINNQSDSVYASMPVITTLSSFQNGRDIPLYKNKEFLMPNKRSSGTFYNLRTMCIVYQAPNFSSAKDFVTYYLQRENNIRLNKEFSTLSILNSDENFRKYTTATEDLLPYFIMVDRVLKKLDID
jgi:ABC-type Fe3+ transport system substrate-binding protein